jgi:hypothetical protein
LHLSKETGLSAGFFVGGGWGRASCYVLIM